MWQASYLLLRFKSVSLNKTDTISPKIRCWWTIDILCSNALVFLFVYLFIYFFKQVTRMAKIKNIRGIAQVMGCGDKVREG